MTKRCSYLSVFLFSNCWKVQMFSWVFEFLKNSYSEVGMRLIRSGIHYTTNICNKWIYQVTSNKIDKTGRMRMKNWWGKKEQSTLEHLSVTHSQTPTPPPPLPRQTHRLPWWWLDEVCPVARRFKHAADLNSSLDKLQPKKAEPLIFFKFGRNWFASKVMQFSKFYR